MLRRIADALLFIVMLAGLAAWSGGCSSQHVDISADGSSQDRYSPADDIDGKAKAAPSDRPASQQGRTAFVSLSTYKWDYQSWLAELRDLTSDLRLPDSTEAMVMFIFEPGGLDPSLEVTCDTPSDACERLRAQVAQLPSLPALPADFPEPQLEVILSRVPR